MNNELLAKLLATEDITVVTQKSKTASFDLENRVLTLPNWSIDDKKVLDHMIGHEVGHALYTPSQEWMDSVIPLGKDFKSTLNIVEDARIEKLVQRKYPGLRRSFKESSLKLLKEGFFGADVETINENYNVVDRLNILMKCGIQAGIQINSDETHWVDKLNSLETFEEAVALAEELHDQCKKDHDEALEESEMYENSPFTNEPSDDDDSESDYGFDEMFDDDTEMKKESSDKGDEETQNSLDEISDDKLEDGTDMVDGSENVKVPPSIEPKTNDAFERNIEIEYNESGFSGEIYNVTLQNKYPKDLIISSKEILDMCKKENGYDSYNIHMNNGYSLYKNFLSNNKKTIDYMAKEFEMKKRAAEYSRTTLSKTGVIDSVKMNNYKFSEDIFRKIAVVPEGKNHGMIMYVDWSGSMAGVIHETLIQTLILTHFCRKVGIPYKVFAFIDGFRCPENFDSYCQENVDKLLYENRFRLIEIFSSESKRIIENTISKYLLSVTIMYKGGVYCRQNKIQWSYVPYVIQLTGTPLDQTIMASIPIHNEFKKKYRLDIVNQIFLSDGASNSIYVGTVEEYHSTGQKRPKPYYRSESLPSLVGFGRNYNIVKIIDPNTKKTYKLTNARRATNLFYQIASESTGSNVIGIRLVGSGSRIAYDIKEMIPFHKRKNVDNFIKELNKNKFCILPDTGCDKMFIIKNKDLKSANGHFEVSEDATKGKIKAAFKRANKGKLKSKVLLQKFVEMVA